MARLGAHGTEVVRYEKRWETPADASVSERRDVLSIRSDGSVLRKHGSVWRPLHGAQAALRWTPWKMYVSAKQAREKGHTIERWRERLLAAGYSIATTRS